MQPAESAENRFTKRKLAGAQTSENKEEIDSGRENTANAAAADDKDALISKLLERLAQKDDQIATIMAKIDGLQTKLESLTELLLKQHSEGSTASTASNSEL